MYNTIGILTGGGDAPGLNAVIRAVGKPLLASMNARDWRRDGFEGLLAQRKHALLSPGDVELLPRRWTDSGNA